MKTQQSDTFTTDGKRFKFCAIDLPGHGSSECNAATFESICDAINEALADLAPVILVGHSYGAAVAATIARRLGQKTQALLLAAPVGLGGTINSSFLDTLASRDSNPLKLGRALAQLTASNEVPPADFVQVLGERLQKRSLQLQEIVKELASNGSQNIDIQKQLEAFIGPTTIIWGRNDKIIDWRESLSVPGNSDHIILANTGHMPHIEQPERFRNIVDSISEWV